MTNEIAVVNSKSFGVYFPHHLDQLNDLGGVDILNIPSNISQLELASELEQYKYIIASVTPYFGKEFFENTPKLKLISRHGLGYNNIDIEAASANDVYVTKVKGIIEQEAVAELAVSLIMSLVRKIAQADISLRTKDWDTRFENVGIEIKDSVVGIIGYGNIGSRVGDILRDGFKAKIIVYDPSFDEKNLPDKSVTLVTLKELLEKSDVISINASATDSNYHMLGENEIQLMKNNVVVVNTARGNLVNEYAIADALNNEDISGYGADVFEKEPIEKDNPLLKSPNTILTPHIGAYTYPSLKGMGDKCVNDIQKVIDRQIPDEVINNILESEDE